MAKEVILMEDVPGLGYTGDLVRVSPGYARNYLLPRNLAAPATDATRKRVEKRKVEAEARRVKDREAALAVAERIKALTLALKVKAGSEGKLFGSVTALDIVGALKTQGVSVEKQQVIIGEAIKSVGEHKVTVRLMQDLSAELKVQVSPE
jgi:large subunit ribosomal protein L9